VAWVALIGYVIARLGKILAGDFNTYWYTARQILEGGPIYPAWQLSGPYPLGNAAFGLGYVYPPTAALLSAPLGLLSISVSWSLCLVAAGIALGGVCFQIARNEQFTTRASVLIAAIVVLSPPSLESLLTGNVNVLIACAVGAAWLRPKLGGYVFVVLGLVKIYPIFGLIWSIRARVAVKGPLAVGVVIVLATLWILGPRPWLDYVSVIVNGQPTSDFILPAPRAFLGGMVGSTVATLAALVLTGLVMFFVRRDQHDHRALFLLSWALILPAPDWYLHYLIVPLVGSLPWGLKLLRPEVQSLDDGERWPRWVQRRQRPMSPSVSPLRPT
jgi:hypothetical protein